MLNEEKTTENEVENELQTNLDTGLLEDMTKSGVLYGRRKAKTHPKMKPYIFATRNGTEILDIEQTIGLIEHAEKFLIEIIKKGGTILCVGTTPASRESLKSFAETLDYPYVNERWLGGTLTNFKTINKRLKYYLQLKSDRDLGKLEKYTKKERLDFDRKIERLDRLFGGLSKLEALPQALFIVGVSAHDTTLHEAKRTGIPVVGVISSDANPEEIEYAIPANDRARSSVNWILKRLEGSLQKAQQEAKAEALKKETEPPTKEKKE